MNKNLVIIALILFFALISFIYKFFVVTKSEFTTLKIGEHEFQVEVAKDDASRIRGLSGREYMAPEQGMLFIFGTAGNHGFWMKGMKFSLDIVWIRDNRIVGITENIPISDKLFPPVYYPQAPADRALELNAGTVGKYNLQVGDSIEVN